MRIRLLLAVVAALLSLPSTANSAIGVDPSMTDDGWPLLSHDHGNDADDVRPRWRVCAPDCGPVVSREKFLEPGHPAPGTTFELTTTFRGRTTSVRSPIWQGQAESVTPPTLTGTAAIGQTVTATAGTWRGGWSTDHSAVSIRACPFADDVYLHELQCRSVTGLPAGPGAPASFRVEAAYSGWYFSATDARDDEEYVYLLPPELYSAPWFRSGVIGPPKRHLIAVSAPLGPVSRPAPEQRPTIHWADRATRVGSKLRLGTIACPIPCGVGLIVRQGTRKVVPWGRVGGTGDLALEVPAKGVRKAGTIRVALTVDGLDIAETHRLKLRKTSRGPAPT